MVAQTEVLDAIADVQGPFQIPPALQHLWVLCGMGQSRACLGCLGACRTSLGTTFGQLKPPPSICSPTDTRLRTHSPTPAQARTELGPVGEKTAIVISFLSLPGSWQGVKTSRRNDGISILISGGEQKREKRTNPLRTEPSLSDADYKIY